MSKHTPGPWKATAMRVTAPETNDRLALDVQINGGNRDGNKANARLIAAAPELLDALETLLNRIELESCRPIKWPAFIAGRAAIQKSTGAT